MSKVNFQSLIYPLLVEVQACSHVLGHNEATAPYTPETAGRLGRTLLYTGCLDTLALVLECSGFLDLKQDRNLIGYI